MFCILTPRKSDRTSAAIVSSLYFLCRFEAVGQGQACLLLNMSIREMLHNYHAGMAAYDRCHPPSITSQWQAFKSEALEFMANPSTSEAWDILHSFGRLLWKVTLIPLQLLALPTVYKHSQRYAHHGCIRSVSNCELNCCVHTTDIKP